MKVVTDFTAENSRYGWMALHIINEHQVVVFHKKRIAGHERLGFAPNVLT